MAKLEGFGLFAKPKREYKPRKKQTTEQKISKLEKQKAMMGIGTPESYRMTELQIETRSKGGMVRYDDWKAMEPDDHKMLGTGGGWITIIKDIPVNADVRPMKWAIYWAVPCADSKGNDGFDPSGRYKLDIIVKHAKQDAYEKISVFPHEYTVIPQEHLDQEVNDGNFILQMLHYSTGEEMDLALIEQGRSLVEEERELIWALQLDGLTETQACNEYFYSRHTSKENHNIWYAPSAALAQELEDTFG